MPAGGIGLQLSSMKTKHQSIEGMRIQVQFLASNKMSHLAYDAFAKITKILMA
jgi:hypothetical protein